jgi:hypothetical protein
MNKAQIDVMNYLNLPVADKEPKEKIVGRPVKRTTEGATTIEYHALSTINNEELVECVRKYDSELASEIQERFNYYFKELAWLSDRLKGK